jgi:hypothetical protein
MEVIINYLYKILKIYSLFKREEVDLWFILNKFIVIFGLKMTNFLEKIYFIQQLRACAQLRATGMSLN